MMDSWLFVVSKWASVGTQPLFWAGVLLALAWWQCGRSPRCGRHLLGMGLLLFVGTGFQILPFTLLQALEARYPKADLPLERYAGVIVLGGAFEHYKLFGQVEGLSQPTEPTPATLMRGQGHWKMVFTGGTGALNPTGPTEADWARAFFEQQGLDMQRIQFETQARNTRENARNTAALLGAECRSQAWLLITAAKHMPRAMEEFLALQCQVHAYPVDFRALASEKPHWSHYDMVDSAHQWQLVLHEWLGVWFYRLTVRQS